LSTLDLSLTIIILPFSLLLLTQLGYYSLELKKLFYNVSDVHFNRYICNLKFPYSIYKRLYGSKIEGVFRPKKQEIFFLKTSRILSMLIVIAILIIVAPYAFNYIKGFLLIYYYLWFALYIVGIYLALKLGDDLKDK
jgi:hypothetical protein